MRTCAVCLGAWLVVVMSGCGTDVAPIPAPSNTPPMFMGDVVGVHDGDSITVLAQGTKETIRLVG